MPSLPDILGFTMLAAADPSAPLIMPPMSTPKFTAGYTVGGDEEDQRIWNFDFVASTSSAGPKVKDVICAARDFGFRRQKVAEEISWGPVSVFLGGKEQDLPLTTKFALGHQNSEKGQLSGNARYWKLDANTDIGWQTVFGYDWWPEGNPSKGQSTAEPEPIVADQERSNFMPPEGHEPKAPEVPGPMSIVNVHPIRIVVVASLVCHKERKNWEPAKTIGAARFYPLVYVMSSHKLDRVEATVRLDRPAACPGCHAETKDTVAPVLFTDANRGGLPGLPTWECIFDYFMVNPIEQGQTSFRMVRPDRPSKRTNHGFVKEHVWGEIANEGPRAEGTHPGEINDALHVVKFPRQGEFDNLHVAPRMRANVATKHKSYVTAAWGLDNVVMAPFCLHDCLHIHWRWGDGPPTPILDATHLKGWSGMTPFAETGAPLVAANQEVTLKLHSKSSFSVLTRCFNVSPGEWQIAFHNGGAYGVAIGSFGDAARAAPEPDPALVDGVVFGRLDWPEFYWHLRFSGPPSGATFWERLDIVNLKGLREL